jgi:chromosome segregation ATPase
MVQGAWNGRNAAPAARLADVQEELRAVNLRLNQLGVSLEVRAERIAALEEAARNRVELDPRGRALIRERDAAREEADRVQRELRRAQTTIQNLRRELAAGNAPPVEALRASQERTAPEIARLRAGIEHFTHHAREAEFAATSAANSVAALQRENGELRAALQRGTARIADLQTQIARAPQGEARFERIGQLFAEAVVIGRRCQGLQPADVVPLETLRRRVARQAYDAVLALDLPYTFAAV